MGDLLLVQTSLLQAAARQADMSLHLLPLSKIFAAAAYRPSQASSAMLVGLRKLGKTRNLGNAHAKFGGSVRSYLGSL